MKSMINIRAALLTPPEILMSDSKKLGLIWSAKAGCTFTSKWFYYQVGHLEKALSFQWVHRYRGRYVNNEIANKSDEYLEKQIKETNFIKIVRNPYTRAVSSYFHATKHINKYRSLADLSPAFSFAEFVDVMGRRDISSVDIHFRSQTHLFERENIITPYRIIKIEESFSSLPLLEKELNLAPSNLTELKDSHHYLKKNTEGEKCFNTPFTKKDMENRVPPYHCFYNDELLDKVYKLYQVDFERYDYKFGVVD